MKKTLVAFIVVVALVSLVGNALLYSRYSSHRTLVSVNGVPITKKNLDDRLEYLYAYPLLTQLIWREMVLQEAEKRHCLPTWAQVDEAQEDIERRDPVALNIARQKDRSLSMYRDELRLSLALRNLRIADVAVTDSEVFRYYSDHPSEFMLPRRLMTTAVWTRDALHRDTVRSMLIDGVSADNIARAPGVRMIDLDSGAGQKLAPEVRATVKRLHRGDVDAYPYRGGFLVVRVNSVEQPGILPFDSVRDRVEIAAKLAKAPRDDVVLAGIRRRALIVCESDKYASAIPPANVIVRDSATK